MELYTELDIKATKNQDNQTTKGSGTCPGWIKVDRACGAIQFCQLPCSDPFCTTCQKIKAKRAMDKWGPEIERFVSPKFFTLTLPGSFDLEAQIEQAQIAFRRLMHTSLGPRNWPKFISQALEFSDIHCDKNDITGVKKHNRRVRLGKSLDRLGRRIRAIEQHNERPARFRDLIDKGVRVSEVTYSQAHGYHFHYHAIADMPFLPWELLVVMWEHATKGEGQIVDIRQVSDDSLAEIFKYSVKGSSIPFEQQDYVRGVLHGKKRVWAIGNISFVEKPKTCPDCGKLLTECKHIDMEFGYTRWQTSDEEAAEVGEMFEVKFHKSGHIDVIQKIDGHWQSVYLIPYVVCAPGDSPSNHIQPGVDDLDRANSPPIQGDFIPIKNASGYSTIDFADVEAELWNDHF